VSGSPAAGRSSAALGVGALAGALVALAALARVVSAGVGGGAAVMVLAGGSALLLGPALALLQSARARGEKFL
jgi:hypothetical protein